MNTIRLFFVAIWVQMGISHGAELKNLTAVNGYRDNQLVGYGIVVGLDGRGDGKIDYTSQSILNALKRFGIHSKENAQITTKNIAAVMVTADVQAFTQAGTRIDIAVSSIGDAKSLQGGILLQTPLLGADGTAYAVAQGAVAIGGFLGGGGEGENAKIQQNHPTVGRIVNGAIVEREIPIQLLRNNTFELNLINPDFVTSVRIADAINERFPAIAKADSPATVSVKLPEKFQGQLPNFIANIGTIDVIPDTKAKIIINERTGTIVATDKVKISTVAISQGNLTITVANPTTVSQAAPFAPNGQTQAVANTSVQVNESSKSFTVLGEYPTLQDLTSALNAIGASTRDIMSILQSIKAAGALQAELVIL